MSIPTGTDVAIAPFTKNGATHRVIDQARHDYVWICPLGKLDEITPDQRYTPVSKIPASKLVAFGEVEDVPDTDVTVEDALSDDNWRDDEEARALIDAINEVDAELKDDTRTEFHVRWDAGRDRVLEVTFDPAEETLLIKQRGLGWQGYAQWPNEAGRSVRVSFDTSDITDRIDGPSIEEVEPSRDPHRMP